MNSNKQTEPVKLMEKWIPIYGEWKDEDNKTVYVQPSSADPNPFGIVLTNQTLENGKIKAQIKVENTESSGRIMFGYNARTEAYYTAGILGHGHAYVINQFVPGIGWMNIVSRGRKEDIEKNADYEIELTIKGTIVSLKVNDVKVIETSLPEPLAGKQLGLFAWGRGKVWFNNAKILLKEKPRIFVVMPFDSYFDAIYEEVILKVTEEHKLEAFRADEIYRPGIIMHDIIRSLLESTFIIAEITSRNENVFYELGYAHAIKKPVILLAEKDGQLPFDISAHRCIFYENSIAGKGNVENQLRKHIAGIMHDEEVQSEQRSSI